MKEKKAVCLLSGGMDSAVTTAVAKSGGYELFCLTFEYGQRHIRELNCAKKLAKFFRASEHKILKIDLDQIGGSALTEPADAANNTKIPTGKTIEEITTGGIPVTYVPARNTIFLSFALAYAEAIGADAIFIGANAVDYSGYPDCRPRYLEAYQKMADLATKSAIEGHRIELMYPLIDLTKADIIKKGMELDVPFHHTWSCYKGGEMACGKCDSCVLRLNGFKEAGYNDPVNYEITRQNH